MRDNVLKIDHWIWLELSRRLYFSLKCCRVIPKYPIKERSLLSRAWPPLKLIKARKRGSHTISLFQLWIVREIWRNEDTVCLTRVSNSVRASLFHTNSLLFEPRMSIRERKRTVRIQRSSLPVKEYTYSRGSFHHFDICNSPTNSHWNPR